MNFTRGGDPYEKLGIGTHREGYHEFDGVSIDYNNKEIDLLRENKVYDKDIVWNAYKSAHCIQYPVDTFKARVGLRKGRSRYYFRNGWKTPTNPKIRGFKKLIKVYDKVHNQGYYIEMFRNQKACPDEKSPRNVPSVG